MSTSCYFVFYSDLTAAHTSTSPWGEHAMPPSSHTTHSSLLQICASLLLSRWLFRCCKSHVWCLAAVITLDSLGSLWAFVLSSWEQHKRDDVSEADFCTSTPLTSVGLYGYSTCPELPLNVKHLRGTKANIVPNNLPSSGLWARRPSSSKWWKPPSCCSPQPLHFALQCCSRC